MKKVIALLALFSVAVFAQNTFTDPRDGKKYKTVKIGNQTWMAENLNYATSDSKCYDNNPANCAKYGRLYSWDEARKTCPKDWHLPNKKEWEALVNLAGGDNAAGKKLKSIGGWDGKDDGTDEYGFSALPGGGGNPDDRFSLVGKVGIWWSASDIENKSGFAYSQGMNFGNDIAGWLHNVKSSLYSVRCVQD